MSKKILVICSSCRKGGNSDALAESFIEGARECGNDVEKVYLADGQISFCRGCLACQKEGATECVMHDYAAQIVKKMEGADVIVFAQASMASAVSDLSSDIKSKVLTSPDCFVPWFKDVFMKKG